MRELILKSSDSKKFTVVTESNAYFYFVIKLEFLQNLFFTQITSLGKIVQIDNDVTYDNGGTQWFSTFKKRPIDAFLGKFLKFNFSSKDIGG